MISVLNATNRNQACERTQPDYPRMSAMQQHFGCMQSSVAHISITPAAKGNLRPLLGYQCKFFCMENDNYSTRTLPLFTQMNLLQCSLQKLVSILYSLPGSSFSLLFATASLGLIESTFRWTAHTWRTMFNRACGENTMLLWLHGNSVSMFTFNTHSHYPLLFDAFHSINPFFFSNTSG